MGIWMVWMVLMGFGRSLDGCLDRGLEAVWRAGWGLEGVWMGVWRGLEGPGSRKSTLETYLLKSQAGKTALFPLENAQNPKKLQLSAGVAVY